MRGSACTMMGETLAKKNGKERLWRREGTAHDLKHTTI